MTLFQAIREAIEYRVAIYRGWRGHAVRICAPGKWRVWREGDRVRHQVLSHDERLPE